MLRLSALASLLIACGPAAAPSTPGDDDPTTPDAAPDPDGPEEEEEEEGCPAGYDGAACVIALYDQAAASCDAGVVAELRAELEARAKLGPLWANGRALFRTDAPLSIAGDFNGWVTTAARSSALCTTDLVLATVAIASGFHEYKLESAGAWWLDPRNPAFAYDDFGGNADGKNSVLNTPDSGRGHVVRLDDACSTELGNCRAVTAYLPPGYTAPGAPAYPVLFMHDGQNLWDDKDCCFGHTGWELNVTLDAKIAANEVAPLVVIGAASTSNRNNEYGVDEAWLATFLAFQTTVLQPEALGQVRWDQSKLGIAGSSLGGLVSMHLALQNPTIYDRVATLSGAFWPGMDTGTALRDRVPTWGKQPLAIYLDHGGDVAQNTDGAANSVEVRDQLTTLGWVRSCTASPTALCYFADNGATHDELAWKARAWRFLEFMYPAG